MRSGGDSSINQISHCMLNNDCADACSQRMILFRVILFNVCDDITCLATFFIVLAMYTGSASKAYAFSY